MDLRGIEADIHSLRQDVEAIRARLDAKSYKDGLYAIDEVANEAAGMTFLERAYFEGGGKLAPHFLVWLSDWLRRKREQYGF